MTDERDKAFERSGRLIGEAALRRLGSVRVAVFGLGGVGGAAAEALARSGVGALDLIDGDRIEPTNLNRQIIALHSTMELNKAEAAAARLGDICPEIKLTVRPVYFFPGTADEFPFEEYDYILDAIDTVAAKTELIAAAEDRGIPIISAMGAGGKLDISMLKVADIYDTRVCPLARVMRRELRSRGIDRLKVVYSEEPPITAEEAPGGTGSASPDVTDIDATPAGRISPDDAAPSVRTAADNAAPPVRTPPASMIFVPAAMGLMMAAEVVRAIALSGGRPDDR